MSMHLIICFWEPNLRKELPWQFTEHQEAERGRYVGTDLLHETREPTIYFSSECGLKKGISSRLKLPAVLALGSLT